MSDMNSALPIRSELPGQVSYTDIIAKIGDGTNPTTQLLGVDTSGRITIKLEDGAGNAITSQANGSQQALDVGINVAGVQIDPRQIRALTSADIVSVVQSTSPWIVKDLADGSVTGGTAGTFSSLAGGVFNTAAPTLTNGQQASLQLDAAGNLKVSLAAEPLSPLNTSDAADGAIANGATGTKAILGGAVYLSSPPTLTSGNMNALLSDVNGNLKVDLATALPAGSNTIGAVTQASGPWTQNLTQVGGSAIALGQTTMSASLPVVIASNQSAIPVSGTVAVTQSTSPWVTSDLADGSVSGGTAGTKSMLGGGIYNSTPPTLTNGQQASLQLDSAGNLDVNLKTAIPAGSNLIGQVNLDVGGSLVSNTNPVPVTISTTTPGTAVQDYHTSAALAASASVTFTYTVAASHTFNFQRVFASASGKIKVLVQNNGSTIFVGFNSTANPNVDITIIAAPLIAAGNTATVTITNLDLLAFDVYATIEGNQN